MEFICYPKCSTCQKAKKWLDENKIVYTERHIVEANPSAEELKMWYKRSGLQYERHALQGNEVKGQAFRNE